MNRTRRVLVELLAPPLGATIIVASISRGDTLTSRILGFPALLIFAYIFGIVPSAIYTAVMELWFEKGYYRRFGLSITVALSGVLGLADRYGVEMLSQQITKSSLFTYLLPVGSNVGVLLGF